jgi:hypothetical protein
MDTSGVQSHLDSVLAFRFEANLNIYGLGESTENHNNSPGLGPPNPLDDGGGSI